MTGRRVALAAAHPALDDDGGDDDDAAALPKAAADEEFAPDVAVPRAVSVVDLSDRAGRPDAPNAESACVIGGERWARRRRARRSAAS